MFKETEKLKLKEGEKRLTKKKKKEEEVKPKK